MKRIWMSVDFEQKSGSHMHIVMPHVQFHVPVYLIQITKLLFFAEQVMGQSNTIVTVNSV